MNIMSDFFGIFSYSILPYPKKLAKFENYAFNYRFIRMSSNTDYSMIFRDFFFFSPEILNGLFELSINKPNYKFDMKTTEAFC